MTVTRQVTWGEALLVEASKTPGGLQHAVNAIRAEVGTGIGVRNTFAKLLKVDDPHALDEHDRFRAWLLITSFGLDPNDWEISDGVVPPSFNRKKLVKQLALVRSAAEGIPRYYWPVTDARRSAGRPVLRDAA